MNFMCGTLVYVSEDVFTRNIFSGVAKGYNILKKGSTL